MLKNLKKWHIAIIIVIGIGAFWLTHNMWIFEKKIKQSEYPQMIIGTWECIVCSNLKFYKTYKVFESDNTHRQVTKNIYYDEPDYISTGTWRIEGKDLIIGWRLDKEPYYGTQIFDIFKTDYYKVTNEGLNPASTTFIRYKGDEKI